MAAPANDHLTADPGFLVDRGPLMADLEGRADPGYLAVDLSELPASLRQGRAASPPVRGGAPVAGPALDPARVQEAVRVFLQQPQHQGSVGDPGDPSSAWTSGTGKGDYGMAGNVVYGGASSSSGGAQMFPLEGPPAGLLYAGAGPGSGSDASYTPPSLGSSPGYSAPPGYSSSPGYHSSGALSEGGHGGSGDVVAAYNALLNASHGAPNPEPGAEQVVARLPIDPDITHADGHAYVEIVVPYAHARLLSVAATKGTIAAVAADGEFLYLVPGGAPGLGTVTSAVAPKFDEVLLTEGDRIGILVRFPPMLGLTGGFVEVTLYTGTAPHVTVR